MASLTVRNLDGAVKNSLRLRATQHGCSMEEEVRQILTEVVQPSSPRGLAFVQRVQQRFAGLDAQALPIFARRPGRTPPRLDCTVMAQRYLLDTNIISELMHPQPAHQVLAWFTQQQNAACFTSTITQAEIFTGIALLPLGKRRAALGIKLPKHCSPMTSPHDAYRLIAQPLGTMLTS